MDSIPKDAKGLLKLLESSLGNFPEKQERFKLPGGEQARFSLERDEESEYPTAKIQLGVPRIEQAIIAAVVALQGEQTQRKRLLRVPCALGAARWTRRAFEALARGEPRPDEPPELKKARVGDTFAGFAYTHVEKLLRHYRPDFDDMPQQDQAALISRVLEKTNKFLDALRELALCIQQAHPYKGLPNSPVKKAARDVKAAELRDIEGMSYTEIGKQLQVNQSENDLIRGDNYRVRTQLVPNGRRILISAWGDEGYKEHIVSSKTEKQRWTALSEDLRDAERYADILDIEPDSMHRMLTASESEFMEEVADLDEKDRFLAAWARAAWQTLPR